jgi:outer membrane protein OmpA-like peptidoglycan-associated protein
MRELPALSPLLLPWLLLPWLLLLGSCSSPPKPPTVDESQKRPVNSAMAVELQVCKNDLQNTRILATESGRMAESTATTLQQLVARQQAIAAVQATSAQRPNSVYTVRFDFGSTRLSIPGEMSAALVDEARQAPLIVLRGRTDGTTDSPGESHIARERAAAVRDHLVSAGVDATRIRATYQPAGDHAADNTAGTGRAMNRRVEIEVYRAAPVAVGVAAPMAVSPSSAEP